MYVCMHIRMYVCTYVCVQKGSQLERPRVKGLGLKV